MDVKSLNVNEFSREEAVEWLRDVGLAVSGTKEELINRIKKYKRYPKLTNKLRSKAKRLYTFSCSVDPKTIPPCNARWKVDDKMLPTVSRSTFLKYSSQKKEGSQGQQEKAFRMLQSRKISTVKVLKENSNLFYVKAVIKKSYGHETRPAVLLYLLYFGFPVKAHCNCPVGVSDLCCHVLAVLLFLKHFHETGEKKFWN